MFRTIQAKFFVVGILVVAIAAGAWWHYDAPRRDWQRMRPALPPAEGAAAPGLDARLQACASRLATWPVDRAALAEFAQLCQANELLESASQAYAALMFLDPGEPRWPHLRARILTGFGRLDEALPLLEKTTVLAPDQAVPWMRLAEARLKSNDVAGATQAFEQVLRLRPNDVHALFGLARCDLQDGRLTAARARLQEAVAADPKFPGAQSLLATVFERLGNPTAAAAARQRVSGDGRYTELPDPWAIDLTAYCHRPYTLLVAASAEVSDERPAQAIPLLERALQLDPRDARLHRQLARARGRLGDLVAARRALERAVELAPDDEKIRSELITLLRQQKDQAGLEQTVAAGLLRARDSPALHFEAGLLAAQAGRVDEAEAHFLAVMRAQPEAPAAPCELAALYFSSGRPERGLAVLEGVLQRDPRYVPALTMLIRYGLDRGDARTGTWLRQALEIGEPSPALAELHRTYERRFGRMP